jgi:hypothetical protein
MSTTSSDGSIDFALYRYTPSIAAGVVFAAIFLIVTILHVIRLWRHRTYFFVPFIIGLLCESSPNLWLGATSNWPGRLIRKSYTDS